MMFRIVLFRNVVAIGHLTRIKDKQMVYNKNAILIRQLEFHFFIFKLEPASPDEKISIHDVFIKKRDP